MGPLSTQRRLRSVFLFFLAGLFCTGQFLPVMADPVFCRANAGIAKRCASGIHTHGHHCCCGTERSAGLKSRCCEMRESQGNEDRDLAVSAVPNLTPHNQISPAVASQYSLNPDLIAVSSGALDWVKSKTLSETIYLNNLNFLC